jgi:hypothetical protein
MRRETDGHVLMPLVAYFELAYANNGISASGHAFREQVRRLAAGAR